MNKCLGFQFEERARKCFVKSAKHFAQYSIVDYAIAFANQWNWKADSNLQKCFPRNYFGIHTAAMSHTNYSESVKHLRRQTCNWSLLDISLMAWSRNSLEPRCWIYRALLKAKRTTIAITEWHIIETKSEMLTVSRAWQQRNRWLSPRSAPADTVRVKIITSHVSSFESNGEDANPLSSFTHRRVAI